MEFQHLNKPRPRINGEMFENYMGKSVCVLGLASDTDTIGMSFQLTTSDNMKVCVRMLQALPELVQGLCEIHGVVKGKKELLCNNYILFPDTHNFDMESYNKAVKLSIAHPEHYIVSTEGQ